MPISPAPAGPAAPPGPARRWPDCLRRGPLERCACAIITAGILMLLQPFLLALYTWSFVVMLAGTLMFMIVSKFPR